MQHNSTASTTESKKKSQTDISETTILSVVKPTPLDFDAFLPWICLQWEVPEQIVVLRQCQVPEKYKKNERKSSSTRIKSAKSLKTKSGEQESDTTKTLNTETTSAHTPSPLKKSSVEHLSLNDKIITLKAIYDARGHLVQIDIINSSLKIPKKLIQAINICLPFHAFLTKLVMRGHGPTYITLYEISKLLPHSNLTNVCLDDSRVPEGNYFVLLDHTSQLKCLSLNRCNINDTVCKEIAVRIELDRPAYSSLMVLELSTNLITDIGAQSLGEILKMNRRLLHINLTGNKITNEGAKAILKYLMEFEITSEEIGHSKFRKIHYMEKKKMVLEKCIDDVIHKNRGDTSSKLSVIKSKSAKFKNQSLVKVIENRSVIDLAESMTKEIMGEFEDPFEPENIVRKDRKYFATGNMILCSLNLSYNYLEYPSIKMIAEVLEYQSRMAKPVRSTGLLRVVIDGNLIPDSCAEYKTIVRCLNNAVIQKIPVNQSNRRRSSSAKKKG